MNVKEKLQWIKNLDGKGRANCITNDNKKKKMKLPARNWKLHNNPKTLKQNDMEKLKTNINKKLALLRRQNLFTKNKNWRSCYLLATYLLITLTSLTVRTPKQIFFLEPMKDLIDFNQRLYDLKKLVLYRISACNVRNFF